MSLTHTHTHRIENKTILQRNSQTSRVSQVALLVKNVPASAGDLRDMGLVPGLGRSSRGTFGNPLQNSCLEYPMDKGAWRAMVHRAAKSPIRLK